MGDMILLIVDDSRMFLKRAKDVLQESGIPVQLITAESGERALEMVRSQRVDIMLLDIIMPGIGGLDVLADLKGDPETRSIDVLMFSSLSDKKTLNHCFELGASDYITKPIDEYEFIARVKSAVKKRDLELEETAYLKEIESQNTRLRDLNARLNDVKGKLLQQEKMAGVGQLAAGVAHEINNPLGFVASNISTMEQYAGKYREFYRRITALLEVCAVSETQEQFVQDYDTLKSYAESAGIDYINSDLEDLFSDTNEGLSRVSRIVKGLRNFSRVDTLEDAGPYDLNEGIENTLIMTRNDLKYAARLELELGEVPEIMAVGGQINQVILNLITNAIWAVKNRYSPALGWIGIRTWRKDNMVYFAVKDNGSGIPQEVKSQIFNPFFTTKPVGEGTGLGLSISYDFIVNKHKGWIDVESQENEGTEFIVALPLASGVERI